MTAKGCVVSGEDGENVLKLIAVSRCILIGKSVSYARGSFSLVLRPLCPQLLENLTFGINNLMSFNFCLLLHFFVCKTKITPPLHRDILRRIVYKVIRNRKILNNSIQGTMCKALNHGARNTAMNLSSNYSVVECC